MGLRKDKPVTTNDVDKVTRKLAKTMGPALQTVGAVRRDEQLVAMYRTPDPTAKDGYTHILLTTRALVDMRDRSYPRFEVTDMLGVTARAGYVRFAFSTPDGEFARLLTFYLEGSTPFFDHFYAMVAGAWTVNTGREFPFAQMENFAQMPPIRFESDVVPEVPAPIPARAPAESVATAPTAHTMHRPASKRRR